MQQTRKRTVTSPVIFIDRTPDSYLFDDGGKEVKYPRLTTIIAPLSDFSGIPYDVLEHAKERGTAVHRACELRMINELDYSTIHPEVEPYFNAFEKFLADTGFRIIPGGAEVIAWSEKYRYGTTLDLVGEMPSAKGLLNIDIKTPATIPSSAGPQTLGQNDAWVEMTGEKKPPRRFALRLGKDGRYVLHEFKSADTDRSTFQSCLNIYRWRERYAA